MKNTARAVVDQMFDAFKSGDIEALVATVADHTKWIYHGTQLIPKGNFEKKEGVRVFFTTILEKTEIIYFEPEQFIVEGNTVVVLGKEHQKVKRSGRELKQKWVQIYTVENALITHMEEFATSEEVT